MTVQPYEPHTPNLIDRATDSWTAVLGPVVDLANNIATTEFVPTGLRGNTAKVVAAILHGRELGLAPMTALAHTQVINGRPGTSAEVMRALILQAGHDLHIETSTAEKCTIKGRRSGWAEDRWTTVTWTIQDAARAGLTEDRRKDGKVTPSMYKRWPAAMLLARATTTLARMVFADVIHGMRSVEELQEMESLEATGLGPGQPVASTAVVSRQQSDGSALAVEAGAAMGEAVPATEVPGTAGEGAVPGTRKRAPRRRTAPPTAPAEPLLVEETPDPEAKPEPEAAAPPAASGDQWRLRTIQQVQMQWGRLLGTPVARDDRLFWTGIVVERPVESTNDLTDEELAHLLNRLGALRDMAALEALVSTGASDA